MTIGVRANTQAPTVCVCVLVWKTEAGVMICMAVFQTDCSSESLEQKEKVGVCVCGLETF